MNRQFQERLAKLREDVSRLSMHRDIVRAQLAAEEAAVEKLRYSAELDQKCSEVIKLWLEDSLRQNVDSISQLVTTGLSHVIHDQELVFRIHQELKHNRLSMKFTIEQVGEGVEADPMRNFGGGAVLVASLILRLAIMARTGMGNLLLLDESMHALANHYVPGAGEFMRQLAEKMGVNILMVTHNDEFFHHSHVAYEAYKDGSLRLRKRSSVR